MLNGDFPALEVTVSRVDILAREAEKVISEVVVGKLRSPWGSRRD